MLDRFLKKKNYKLYAFKFTFYSRKIFIGKYLPVIIRLSRLLTTRVTHSRLAARDQRNREERAGYRERDKRS